MKKLVISMLTLCNVAFAQTKSEAGGGIELESRTLQTALNNIAANIENKVFKNMIQSFNIELRDYPTTYQIISQGMNLMGTSEPLVSISEDKKDLVVFAEIYRMSHAHAHYNLVRFMLETRLERKLTAPELGQILNAMGKN